MTSDDHSRAQFIYDGDCDICREWVAYWQALTGDEYRFRPYQAAAADFPTIEPAAFARAVHFIDADGHIKTGAAATFALYRNVTPHRLLPWLYKHVPGVAPVSEWAYRVLSGHRRLLTTLTHSCWGKNPRPAAHTLTSWLFLRLLGLIYLAAFASLAVQVLTLIGSDGLLPLSEYLGRANDTLGDAAWRRLPMVFWLNAGDRALQLVCALGCVAALCLTLSILVRSTLILLFVLYLSLFYAGQSFMAFQWDLLLLEAGFLGMFLPYGSRWIVWLYRWLAFRFMFLGGVVKIVSADPTWDTLTALRYHFETQPLPTPLAWYAHHLPDAVLSAAAGATLIIELLLPFLLLTPRRLRMFAGGCFVIFQCAIILTGNYNFFNLLTIIICLFLFDDAALGGLVPARVCRRITTTTGATPGRLASALAVMVSIISLFVGAELMLRAIAGQRQAPASALTRLVSPCACINGYGPFAVMTTVRNEIIIEGQDSTGVWREYEFKYKPGGIDAPLFWNIPHQPRVDWQLWFAALSNPENHPWFRRLLALLLLNNQRVHTLFRYDPFPQTPPRAVRALYYNYRFTTPAERTASGHWWRRQLLGVYYPPIKINLSVDTGLDH